MKACIFITHPSQFDAPVFRMGSDFIHVVFTDPTLCQVNFDPELNRNVKWEDNIFNGFSFEVLPKCNPFSVVIKIFNILKKGKYDLVITSGYFRYEYIISIILSMFLSKKNAIRVDSVGFNNFGLKKIVRKCILVIINLFVDYFFVVGTLSRNFIIENGINSNKIKFFGYITNSDYFRKESTITFDEKLRILDKYKISISKKIVLCVSKHIQREAPFDTIKAFSLLRQEGIHLVLVGDGELNQELKSLANDLNLTNISFVGYIDYKLLPLFYSISSVFVHDSKDEPWGVSVQEAIACNIPVIASNKVGAGYDLIYFDKNGYTYEIGDVNDLSKKIEKSLLLNKKTVMETNIEILDYWKYETIISEIKSAIR